MVFSSTVFLFVFLPLFLAVYILLPSRLQNVWLLLSSLVFYAWGEPWFVLVLCASIAINFACGLLMSGGFTAQPVLLAEGTRRSTAQVFVLVLSIVTNLAILSFFKYWSFGVSSVESALSTVGLSGPNWAAGSFSIVLPLGISFFTFQSMSYTIDVYRGQARATRNPIHFAAYVSMFPQLVAGPIVRYKDIAGRLAKRSIEPGEFSCGAHRFIVGLAKKVLVADAFAVPADAIFALPKSELTLGLAWLGVFSYTLQIYFDFSGYSDMAIGLGRMIGFRFHENFNYPYVAQSMTEFWRRWHISLSTWFRDYLYLPLGGNRGGRARTVRNLCVVFLLCGLWHGASWNFAAWGVYHGAFLSIERLTRKKEAVRSSFVRGLGHAYVVLAVMAGWVLFRADSFDHAAAVYAAMVGLGHGSGAAYYPSLYLSPYLYALSCIAVAACMPVIPRLSKLIVHRVSIPRAVTSLRLAGTIAVFGLLILTLTEIAATTHRPFIYFRF